MRPRLPLPIPLPLALALLLAAAPPAAAPAAADSALVLPPPAHFGEVAATTYDRESGARLGEGYIRLSRDPGGKVRMEGQTGIDGGAQTHVRALLAPTADGTGLRPLSQESRSLDPQGRPLGVLEIDHVAGEGRCTAPTADGQPPVTKTVALTAPDRVVNVPMNLLFQPMVRGETREMRFQILLCSGGPRVVTAIARADGRPTAAGLVQIRYELSLPKLLAKVVQRWLPHLSFWFDPQDGGAWIGHEMPLYSKGPTVLMVRDGFEPSMLREAP